MCSFSGLVSFQIQRNTCLDNLWNKKVLWDWIWFVEIKAPLYTALWSLQIVCCVLPQEISRNFKGIWDSATLKRFYSPFLQSQFYIKKKKTKLWLIIRRFFSSIDHKSPQCLKKRVISKTNISTSDFNRWIPPSQPSQLHQSTSLSRSLGHAFAETNPSMPNMSSEAFYPLQCCHSSSSCFCSCCYLQAPAKIAARWR